MKLIEEKKKILNESKKGNEKITSSKKKKPPLKNKPRILQNPIINSKKKIMNYKEYLEKISSQKKYNIKRGRRF